MTLTLNLSGEVESRLAAAAHSHGMAPADYALQIIERDLSEQQRRQRAADLLQSWIDQGNADEQRATYEYLTRALDDDRPADRKLFPPDLQGITW
jgi:predicted DNA-binding protein